MLPCGFAAGIAGALPMACCCGGPSRCRSMTVPAPISATMRPNAPAKLIYCLPHRLAVSPWLRRSYGGPRPYLRDGPPRSEQSDQREAL